MDGNDPIGLMQSGVPLMYSAFVRSLHYYSGERQRASEENGVWYLQGADREGELFTALCQGRWWQDNTNKCLLQEKYT